MNEIVAHHGLFKDTNLHVDDTGGDGRPVVLIHGWPLSGESWARQIPALRDAGYRVVTYDRRGFGRSDKPLTGYTYDTLTDDLYALVAGLGLRDVTLVGFSMGGGEAARYFSRYGSDRIRSVVFAAAVVPYLMHGHDNPEGPLTKKQALQMATSLAADKSTFFEGFVTDFYSANGNLTVGEDELRRAREQAALAGKEAALACMAAFGGTDFRGDLPNVSVPALVLHGDSDGIVPYEGSGKRTHDALPDSSVHLIAGAPHGCNISHDAEFNDALLAFLAQ